MVAAHTLLLTWFVGAAPTPDDDGYRALGVSNDGAVLLHHVDIAATIDRIELLPLEATAPVPCAKMPPSLSEPPYPGLAAPEGGAAVLVRVPPDAGGTLTLDLVDGNGTQRIAELTTTCPDGTSGDGRPSVTVGWLTTPSAEPLPPAPSTSLVVITGTLPRCEGDARAFVRVAKITSWLDDAARRSESATLVAEVDVLGTARVAALAEAAVGLVPDDPAPLVTLARVRAREGDSGSAIAALWALSRSTDPAAPALLEAAIGSDWAASLADRAAFRALVWTVSEARPPKPLVPDLP